MAAGNTTLDILARTDVYDKIEELGAVLEEQLRNRLANQPVKLAFNRLGSMFSWFFTDCQVRDYDSVMTANPERYKAFFAFMLEQGISLPPSPFEVCFISAAHNIDDIELTVKAVSSFLEQAG